MITDLSLFIQRFNQKAMPIFLPQAMLQQSIAARGHELVSLRFAPGLFWPKTFANICMVMH
jgi:hypothetical protein